MIIWIKIKQNIECKEEIMQSTIKIIKKQIKEDILMLKKLKESFHNG